jgi:hypothetical protein
MTMETMAGTPTMKPTVMMAPPVMMVPETMAAVAAVMMMATLARFLQSSDVDSQAPTCGSVSVDVSSQ